MLFDYKAIADSGEEKTGSIEAVNVDVAISSLQRRGMVITSIDEVGEGGGFFDKNISFFEKVSTKDIVIFSRQVSTLFEAQVPALKTFRLLAAETENPLLGKKLNEVADDIQGGISISDAMAKHPAVFSDFYVNMIKAGEESGKLNETFIYLADYLDRYYELISKTKNALVYPAFVIGTFFVVMILMLTMVIPRLAAILLESGGEIPIYTKIVIGLSNFFVNYGIFFGILFVLFVMFLWRFKNSEKGQASFDAVKMGVPFVGSLYRKLYLSRIADNINTMLSSGISMVRAMEVTSKVVGSKIFEDILKESTEEIKSGSSMSDALSKYPEIPSIMVQMVRIGEETGNLGNVLETLAKFYKREVDNAVDTLVGLIEPIMIVALGLGVGFLLTSVLVPIYSITAGI